MISAWASTDEDEEHLEKRTYSSAMIAVVFVRYSLIESLGIDERMCWP